GVQTCALPILDFREFKERVFAAGKANGLEELEVYATRSRSVNVRVFDGQVDDYRVSVEQGVGLRARFGGKVGYAYVEKLDEDSVDFLVQGVKANAQIIESADEVVFHEGSASYPQEIGRAHV